MNESPVESDWNESLSVFLVLASPLRGAWPWQTHLSYMCAVTPASYF